MGQPAPTGDLDCLARFDHENLARLAAAMRELNARLRAEGLSDVESIYLTAHLPSPEFFARGEITTWMTDAGPLDILHDMPSRDGARLSYDELNARATTHAYVGGVTIRVAALDDIVASKQWANRPKDRRACPNSRRSSASPRPPAHAIEMCPARTSPSDESPGSWPAGPRT